METRIKELARSEYLLACLPAEGVRYSAVPGGWPPPAGHWMGPNVDPGNHNAMAGWNCCFD